MKKNLLKFLMVAAILTGCGTKNEELSKEEFANPPVWAGVDSWWHWCGQNITRTGINRDLNAMHDRGIKRVTIFDLQGHSFENEIPAVKFNTPEWFDMFEYALQTADSLGMQVGVHNCAGWATSGGSWMSVEQSMKECCWSKTEVKGGAAVEVALEQPQTVDDFYRDVAVVAYQKPVTHDAVLNISEYMDAEGILKWDAPAGDWTVLRFGYTTNGQMNKPTNPGDEGYECDKMDADAVQFFFDSFIGPLAKAMQKYIGKTFTFVLADSWECHFQDWTAKLPEEFAARKGYDIIPWLPAIAGELEDGEAQSADFLREYYDVVAAMIDENYYDKLIDLVHGAGLQFHSEPIYGSPDMRGYAPLDILKASAKIDLPMYEFWAMPNQRTLLPDFHRFGGGKKPVSGITLESSIFTGNPIVGSEAYTGYANFSETPQLLKPFGDEAYCGGINQLILHSYVMQPFEGFPIVALKDKFGGHYNRNNPWYNLSDGWFEYQTRVQYVLQQGDRVADYLYYAGDQYPQWMNWKFRGDRAPVGYRENIVNLEFLDKALDYGLLVIPQNVTVAQKTLEKLEELKAKGLKVWYDDGVSEFPLDRPEDFTNDVEPKYAFLYTHRTLGDKDIYFVFNQREEPLEGNFLFRVEGKVPEIWNPETGAVNAPLGYSATEDGRTSVKIAFEPQQTLFVIFDKKSKAAPMPSLTAEAALEASRMTVSFEPVYDDQIPEREISELKSFTDFEDASVRYFGGYATYTIDFDLPQGVDLTKDLAIDFGKVGATAKATLNGEELGFLWHDGQRLPAKALKAEGNTLVVKVATSLRNRMIGDMIEFGKPVRVPTFTRLEYIPDADKPLFPCGLRGPLTIKQYE